jgi:hypothetical protein
MAPELAAAGRFTTLRGTPKLGKSNPVADNIKGRTLTYVCKKKKKKKKKTKKNRKKKKKKKKRQKKREKTKTKKTHVRPGETEVLT